MIPRALIHETHSRTHSDIHFSLPHWHIFAHFSIVSTTEKERERGRITITTSPVIISTWRSKWIKIWTSIWANNWCAALPDSHMYSYLLFGWRPVPGIITEKPIETQTQSEFGLGLVTSTSTSTSTTTTTMSTVWVWVCLWVWVAVWFVMRRMWMWQAEFSRFGRMAWAVCNRLDDWVFDFF